MIEFRTVNVATADGDVIGIKVPVGPTPTPAEADKLRIAFGLVAPDGDWKGRIDKRIILSDIGKVGLVLDAIEFMTATEGTATMTRLPDRTLQVHFTAIGYRMGPAGP